MNKITKTITGGLALAFTISWGIRHIPYSWNPQSSANQNYSHYSVKPPQVERPAPRIPIPAIYCPQCLQSYAPALNSHGRKTNTAGKDPHGEVNEQ